MLHDILSVFRNKFIKECSITDSVACDVRRLPRTLVGRRSPSGPKLEARDHEREVSREISDVDAE